MLVTPFKSRSDYQVLGLDQWNGNSASVQAFKTITGVSFPLLLNAADVAASYKTTYDRLVVIDQNGEIVFSGTLGAANDISAVKQKVETLLGKQSDDPPVDTKGDAPDFTLNSLAGSSVGLAGYKNKVVVLFFFGNTCPACKAAAPGVESTLVTPYASRSDYQVLGLDQWDGNTASVQGFKTATGVSFPLLLNASGVASDYKTTYDRLVVIDQKGNVVFKGTRGASSDVADVNQKVKILLGL
jgi:peroxiredoxin